MARRLLFGLATAGGSTVVGVAVVRRQATCNVEQGWDDNWDGLAANHGKGIRRLIFVRHGQ